MIEFPVFEELQVTNYRLYPGTSYVPGLTFKIGGGPWIVLGVNGLGKSTLLLLLKHVLVGAVHIRNAGFTGERSDILAIDQRFFAARVGGAANNASAHVRVRFGVETFLVERRLSDLSLVRALCTRGSKETPLPSEADFRSALAKSMGLAGFDDALRVLEGVSFVLEGRDPLIWNVAAQFELFRALLTPDISADLRRLEGEVVSKDSTARNLNAVLYKLTTKKDSEVRKRSGAARTHAELARISADLDVAVATETKQQATLEICERERADARLAFKTAERNADRAVTAYEEIKFEALKEAFEEIPPNDQYILLKLITDRNCMICGNAAEGAAVQLEERRNHGECLVCGSKRASRRAARGKVSQAAHARTAQAWEHMINTRDAKLSADEVYVAADRAFASAADELQETRQKVDMLQREVWKFRKKLPVADQSELARNEDRVKTLRREVQTFRHERDAAENEIEELLHQLTTAAEGIRAKLERNFDRRARDFFAERVRLVYAPRKDKIGQGGRSFDFPAFEVEMTSGATEGQFVRRTPEQVSLSQREYLDIIFRMSLMETLSSNAGSLVLDGPEGSLDAVFAERAGNMLATYCAGHTRANLIAACNVVEGAFIPNTLRAFSNYEDRKKRVVNLLDLAAPTAALTKLQQEYRKAVTDILRQDARQ